MVMRPVFILSSMGESVFSAEEEDGGSARQNSGSRTNTTESTVTNLSGIVASFVA